MYLRTGGLGIIITKCHSGLDAPRRTGASQAALSLPETVAIVVRLITSPGAASHGLAWALQGRNGNSKMGGLCTTANFTKLM
jgi:hypothetical protein